jgi:hypothetical protein
MSAPFGPDDWHLHWDGELGTERRPPGGGGGGGTGQANGSAADAAPNLDVVWAEDIKIEDDLGGGGAIDGLLPCVGMVVMYGDSNTGKTFVAVDMACHVAAGLPWRGLEVEQGVVIYVAAEAPASLKRRIWAWKQRHPEVERLPLLVVQSTVDLLNGSTDELVKLIKQITDRGERVAMVVIDTLARSMTGNENSAEDMGKYVSSCAKIREAGGSLPFVVHHTGKDLARGARGHSSLRAATDVELEVTPGQVKVTKERDEAGGHTYGFKLDVIELGQNAKGRMVTTCVAVDGEAPAKAAKKTINLKPAQKVMLDCLHAALVDLGREPPPHRDIPRGVKAVTFEQWVDATVRYSIEHAGEKEQWRCKDHAKRTAGQLQGKDLVLHVAGWCWLPKDGTTSHKTRAGKSR